MSAQLKHRVVETAVEELTIPIKSAPYNKDNVMKAVDNSVLLRVENISKKFPGTLALDNVSLDINRGEVHVLFGENGAGKSTLIQIIAGVHRPTKGKIFLDGQEVELHTVHQARNLGISAVFQEFSIIPQLTVGENLFLGSEMTKGPLLDKTKLRDRANETLERLGFPLDPNKQVMYLSRAEQQMVEIAKAFRTKPLIVILDEPTASLTERETDQLFSKIEELKAEGIGIIYITHRINEIQRIGDRVTVLRDGKLVSTIPVKEANEEKLVELMTGRIIDQIFPNIQAKPDKALLNIESLTLQNDVLQDVSMEIRGGEVVGIAGLVGSGKSQVGRAVFGLENIASGKIDFCGDTVYSSKRHINYLKPRVMLDRGMYYLPSDRREEGLMMVQNVRENVSLASLGLKTFSYNWFLRRGSEKKTVKDISKKLDLNPPNIERHVEHFSGGNQQKALVGKALVRDVKLFIFDEPTVGVDVGARMLIYKFIGELCEEGAGVILISSDLPEILNLAHRAYVMHRGVLQAELPKEQLSEKNILKFFFEKEECA
jgi:ribose transport system ATP-binding protein